MGVELKSPAVPHIVLDPAKTIEPPNQTIAVVITAITEHGTERAHLVYAVSWSAPIDMSARFVPSKISFWVAEQFLPKLHFPSCLDPRVIRPGAAGGQHNTHEREHAGRAKDRGASASRKRKRELGEPGDGEP